MHQSQNKFLKVILIQFVYLGKVSNMMLVNFINREINSNTILMHKFALLLLHKVKVIVKSIFHQKLLL